MQLKLSIQADPEKRHSTSLDVLLPQDLISNEKYSNDKHNFFDSYQNKNEPHNHQQQSQQHYTFLKESENGLFPHLNNTTQILQHPQKNLPFGLMQDSNPIDRLYSMQSIYFNSEWLQRRTILNHFFILNFRNQKLSDVF